MKKSVLILDGLRTSIGSPFKSLKNFTASQLAAYVIKGLVARNKIKKNTIDEIILGNVVSAGSGQNIARQASLLAGLPNKIVAYMINSVCGSSLHAVITGHRAIISQDAETVICGGSESATHSPFLIKREDRDSLENIVPFDSLASDGLTCQITNSKMGDLVEKLAGRYEISRQQQDEYSLLSHRKACSAQDNGCFKNEIIDIRLPDGRMVIKDDRPRSNTSIEKLALLPTVFKHNGTITAGNSSSSGDGSAAVLLASEQFVKKNKKVAIARVVGYTSIFIDPIISFESAVDAIKEALRKSNFKLKDIDLFEICEAFAAQAIFVKDKLKIPDEKFNIYGGDIALGHPLGATGARILVTLINGLRQKKLKRGLACVSFGGGGAVAIIVEAI